MEVELPTDETVRALRVQTLLWTAVETMILKYTRVKKCTRVKIIRENGEDRSITVLTSRERFS